MIEWLNDNPGAVQAGVGLVLTLTLLAVLWYACETRKLAKEAREQRLDLDRPYLLLEVRNLDALEWKDLNDPSAGEPDVAATYPKSVTYHVYNAGRGPAKEIVTTLLQPLVTFEERKRDLLMPGAVWRVEVKASELLAALHEGFTGEKPLGMERWMKSQGIRSAFYGAAYDCGLMVGCTDIHDRRWATYSKFTLILSEVSTMGKAVTRRTLVPLEHRIVRLEGAE